MPSGSVLNYGHTVPCVQEVNTPIYIVTHYLHWGTYFLDTQYDNGMLKYQSSCFITKIKSEKIYRTHCEYSLFEKCFLLSDELVERSIYLKSFQNLPRHLHELKIHG